MTQSILSADLNDFLEVIRTDAECGEMEEVNKPYIEIIEEPKSKVRFRYECEGRSAGSILGVSSTSESKTFPTIKIKNHKGTAIVVASCVTKDEPYMPHPHKLVGKEHCNDGIYTIRLESDDMTLSFTNLGIQCMKKKDIDDSLKMREKLKIDPFKTGFSHRTKISSINLNVVRLCFQVYLPVQNSPSVLLKLRPVVSEPIYDAKSNSDLIIHNLSHASAPVTGGMKMILLCDKVTKEDIKVRFFEEQNGVVVWEGYGDFQPQDVHKQYAIVFKTPKYRNIEISDPINVKVQLENSKSSSYSEAYNFTFMPLDSEEDMKRKRLKIEPEYLQDLESNLDPETRRRKYSRADRRSPLVKVETSEGSPHNSQYLYAGVPGTSFKSRTPSPSYAPPCPPLSVYPQHFSPDASNTQGRFPPPSQPTNIIIESRTEEIMLYSLSPQPNAVYVPPDTSEHAVNTVGGNNDRFPNILTNLDTQETSYERSSQDSLNEINSKDLYTSMDTGTLSDTLANSLNLSDNMSDSLTNIATQAYNKNFA